MALTSEMRFAEIVGLTTDDFYFDLNEITINKTWDYKKGKGFAKTKNDSSNRTIKMDSNTMNLFKKLVDEIPNNMHNLVFYSPRSSKKVLTNELSTKY